MKSRLKSNRLLFACALFATISSCNYSFTGASISPDVKTLSIQYFPNYSSLGPPYLSQSFTEALKDLFIRQTSLTLVSKNGDLQFEGQISGYSTTPAAIQSDDRAASNRLSITVQVRFVNTKDETQNFETSFSRFEDYSSSQDLATVEEELIGKINEQLVQDIFNKSVSNW
jgi:outer membrane lipopolysaccharide assembly protein LptE/RlpB